MWRRIFTILFVCCPAVQTSAQQIRRPVALAMSEDILFVANRRSGSITAIDTRQASVIGETLVGKTLADICVSSPLLYAVDESANELIRLSRDRDSIRVVDRISVPANPVSITVSDDGSICTVASLWSRRITIVELKPTMRVRHVVDLPFAPRTQCLTLDERAVIVADAFGGHLARIDITSGRLASVRTLQAHNIRGLRLSADGSELLVTHQMLAANTPTEPSRITWGQVVGNVLRSVPVREFEGVAERPIEHWSLYPLGQNGRGAGDPGDISITPGGTTAVALSGVNEVAIRTSPLDRFTRIDVGRNPTALEFSSDASRLFIANTMDDSISVIDVGTTRVNTTIDLGPNTPSLSEEDLGEQLFHDARLSLDGWYSCQSCHTDGHTNAGLNDNSSDGSFGTPKQIPSLLGVEPSRPWGWSGQMPTHEVQVQQSILRTMHGRPTGASSENVNAISAFIRSLPPAPGIATARGEANAPAVARGREVFNDLRCGHCHSKPDFTSERSFDVDLEDESGLRRYNPPSLLGVSQRDALLHDGRAKSLDEVFTKFKHPEGKGTEDESVDDLIAYLRSL